MSYQRQKERFAAADRNGGFSALGHRRHPMTDPERVVFAPGRSPSIRFRRRAATTASASSRWTSPTAGR